MANIRSSPRREIFKKKHDSGYPFNAITFVLNQAKLKLSEIDHIVFLKTFFKIRKIIRDIRSFCAKGLQIFLRFNAYMVKRKIISKKISLR